VTPRTLPAILERARAHHGAADALVFPDQRLSYSDLSDCARLWAQSLIALGVQPGDHVGLLLPTCPEFVELMFAIALAGAVCVPINARYAPPELAYLIENADLVVVITTDRIADAVDFVARLRAAFPDLDQQTNPRHLTLNGAPKLRSVALLGTGTPAGLLSELDLRAAAAEAPAAYVDARAAAVTENAIALILYTSGTTSNPKGCLIHHGGIVGNSTNLAKRYRLTSADRFWSPLPIFHIAGILPLVAIYSVGGSYLTIPFFEAGTALGMLERERATATYPSFVTIMQDLIAHPNFQQTDLSRVTVMNANFGVQPGWIRDAMLKAMPHAIFVGTYGLTEGAGTICTSRLDDPLEQRLHRLGVPLDDWEVEIRDLETGLVCGVNERGEICARGPHMLRGYYKDLKKTAEAIDPQGWFHSGDIGSFDADGTIMFHGRAKDMLKIGGENVAAAEIEAVLGSHPSVKLAQVVGAPHERYVEVAAAFIELVPGAQSTESEMIEFCRGKLASFKIPRHIRFVGTWPMSTSKVQKYKLREQLILELQDSAS
jgi:fatty-acyl-CoA synthase